MIAELVWFTIESWIMLFQIVGRVGFLIVIFGLVVVFGMPFAAAGGFLINAMAGRLE